MVAADAETAPRVRFTSSDGNFPSIGTLRAVSYSVIYNDSVCTRGQGIYWLKAKAGTDFSRNKQGTHTAHHAVSSGKPDCTGDAL